MKSRQHPARAQRPPPRLYLFSERGADEVSQVQALALAIEAADVAAVLLRLPGLDDRTVTKSAKRMGSVVQPRGIALLLEGHPELVARAEADGAHIAVDSELTAALKELKPDRIVGAGGLKTRHDAMVAAEAGADYVMFGEPDAAGQRPAFSVVIERVEWWSEVFEIPCVGFAAAFEEIAELAQAGADFVALDEVVWKDARGPAATLAAATEQLRAVELA